MKISSNNYSQSISKKGKVIVNFYADWCHDCNVVSALYDELSKKLGNEISFFEIDTDEEPELEKENNVKRIPTFIFFENGIEKERFHEPSPKELAERILRFSGKA